jgi:hypothetical protein
MKKANTNNMNLAEAITLVAIEATEDMLMELKNGCKITAQIYHSTIDLTIDLMGLKFETQMAKVLFASHVNNEIARKYELIYRMAFPKYAYTANGILTTDESKWV